MGPRLRLVIALLLCSVVQAQAAEPPGGGAGPGVIVAQARPTAWTDRTEALGTLRANESVVITANVTETISVIGFNDGQRVKQGDLLVEMTSAEEHGLLEEVVARVAEAERQFNRVKSLASTGSASVSLLDERRRDLDTARASLVAVESRLADRLVKAPFSGVVGLRNISLGALVEPGDVITTLDDDDIMKLDFAVPSIYLSSLAPGLGIKAEARAYDNRVFQGEISAIDTRVDPVTRSVQVRALIDNRDHLLRPGLLMRVELLRNPRQSLMIPEGALVHQGEDHFVLVVDPSADNRVERRQIQIGARRPGEVEVVAGVAADELVVTHGAEKAKPGESVKVLAIDDGTRTLAQMLKPEEGGAAQQVQPAGDSARGDQ